MDTGDSIEYLVDGQQRITTLYQYFKGYDEIKLPSGFPAYSELTKDDKEKFLQYNVVIRDLGIQPLPKIKEIFQRINSTSYGLNSMEINNARYAGAYKIFNEEFSMNKFFSKHHIFTPNDIHRMKDVIFCLTITTTLLESYFNLDSEVEAYLQKYDEEFPYSDEMKINYEKIFNMIEIMKFDEKSRIFKKADFFTIFIELYKAVFTFNKQINLQKLTVVLKDFYTKVNECKNNQNIKEINNDYQNYYKLVIQGSNNRASRILRGEIIQQLISTATTTNNNDEELNEISSEEHIEEMKYWFLDNYEDPAESCPYDSSEGGYTYFNGGPFDAQEELYKQFGKTYKDKEIEKAAKEIEDENEVYEWEKIESKNDEEDV